MTAEISLENPSIGGGSREFKAEIGPVRVN
jgi:hypothetical protein